MCKSNTFVEVQNEAFKMAVAYGQPKNVLNSIAYSVCLHDLRSVLKISKGTFFKAWLSDRVTGS